VLLCVALCCSLLHSVAGAGEDNRRLELGNEVCCSVV